MPLRTEISASISGVLSRTLDQGPQSFKFLTSASHVLADGTGNGQANAMFSDTRTLAGAANEELDLAGVLVDPHGATLTFTKIKAIIIKASVDNPDKITIGGSASNAFLGPFGNSSDVIDLLPGNAIQITNVNAGWTVTAGTADKLKILNADADDPAVYEIILIGVV